MDRKINILLDLTATDHEIDRDQRTAVEILIPWYFYPLNIFEIYHMSNKKHDKIIGTPIYTRSSDGIR